MGSLETHLLDELRESLTGLTGLSERRMFGSDGLFANGYAFAIVWDGRIVLKIADETDCEGLLKVSGANPFNPMGKGKGMSGWIVVPESFHDDSDELRHWARLAYRHICMLPPKSGKKPVAKTKGSKR